MEFLGVIYHLNEITFEGVMKCKFIQLVRQTWVLIKNLVCSRISIGKECILKRLKNYFPQSFSNTILLSIFNLSFLSLSSNVLFLISQTVNQKLDLFKSSLHKILITRKDRWSLNQVCEELFVGGLCVSCGLFCVLLMQLRKDSVIKNK